MALNVKREILQIILSGLLLAICIETGWINPEHSLLGNLGTAIFMYVMVKLLSYVLS